MGVPQDSVLGPILFLIYINDMANCLDPDIVALHFADDTTLQCTSADLHSLYTKLNYNLHLTEQWFNTNKLSINTKKPCTCYFITKNTINIHKSCTLQVTA